MKHLKKHPKQQRMEDMTFPITKPGNKTNKLVADIFDRGPLWKGKKTKEMHRWDKVIKESADALEENRCQSCGVYPGSSHTERCETLLEIRKRAWKEYKKNDRVIWTGHEFLRSINDDMGFTIMSRLAWRMVAVGVLGVAVIYSLFKVI